MPTYPYDARLPPLPSELGGRIRLNLRRGDAELIRRALQTTAEVVERRSKGLHGLADALPRRAAQLRRLATVIEAELEK